MFNLLTSSETNQADITSISEWFKLLWEGIKSLFVSGNISSNTVTNSFLGRLIIAIIVFIPTYLIIKVIIYLLKRPNKKAKNQTAKSFIASATKGCLYLLLAVIILSILGIPLTGLSTIISSAVVAIGLSLQSVISNFASGIIIISTKKFKKGDFISLNNGQAEGVVDEIKVLETKLLTTNNISVSVPNSDLFTGTVTNYSLKKFRRIDFIASCSYGNDIEQVKKVILSCIKKQPGVNLDMKYTTFLKVIDDSNLDFAVRCYVPTSIYWDVLFSLQENIYKEFINRKIAISYNQMDVHIDNDTTKVEKIDMSNITPKDYLENPNPISPNTYDEDDSNDVISNLLSSFDKSISSNKNKKKGK